MEDGVQPAGAEATESGDTGSTGDPWAIDVDLSEGADLDMGQGVIYEDESEPEEKAEVADETPAEVEAEGGEEKEPEPGQVASTFEPDKWDGNIDSIPDDLPADQMKDVLRASHKHMERGVQKNFQRVAELRKQYEAKLEGLAQGDKREPSTVEGPPAMPGENATPAEWQGWQQKTSEFYAEKTAERVLAERLPDITNLTETVRTQEGDRRMARIVNQAEYTDEIGQLMSDIAEANPHWGEALKTSGDRDLELFEIAKAQVELSALRKQVADQGAVVQKAEAEEEKRKATAPSRAVSRPGTGSKSGGPADRYAGRYSLNDQRSMDALAEDVLEEYERSIRSR